MVLTCAIFTDSHENFQITRKLQVFVCDMFLFELASLSLFLSPSLSFFLQLFYFPRGSLSLFLSFFIYLLYFHVIPYLLVSLSLSFFLSLFSAAWRVRIKTNCINNNNDDDGVNNNSNNDNNNNNNNNNNVSFFPLVSMSL